MKIFYSIAYVFHKIMRFIHMVPGSYQSKTFEYHHKKMKKFKGLLLIVGMVLFLFSQSTTADFLSEEDKTVNVAESLLQSVVSITVFESSGSGFYISENEIITNQHVVKDKKSVFIEKSDGTNCLADIIYTQSDTDLALLKTDCKGKPLTLADNVKVGQSILTMGNPLEQNFFVSKGIVGLINTNGVLHDAITDQGMSGGPVINLNGQLVGVIQGSAKKLPKMSIAIDTKTLSYFLFQARGK